jgi:hypothetical protein
MAVWGIQQKHLQLSHPLIDMQELEMKKPFSAARIQPPPPPPCKASLDLTVIKFEILPW